MHYRAPRTLRYHDLHPKGAGHFSHRLTQFTIPDNTHGLSRQLPYRVVKQAKLLAGRPVPINSRCMILLQLSCQEQNQAKNMFQYWNLSTNGPGKWATKVSQDAAVNGFCSEVCRALLMFLIPKVYMIGDCVFSLRPPCGGTAHAPPISRPGDEEVIGSR